MTGNRAALMKINVEKCLLWFMCITGITGITTQLVRVNNPIALFYYYTILTNILCIFIGLFLCLNKKIKEVKLITIIRFLLGPAIIIVFLVSHFFLRSTPEASSSVQNKWQLFADLCLHYIVPVLYVIDWIIYFPKDKITWKLPIISLSWPLIYCLFVYIRAFFGSEYDIGYGMSKYPYFFLDINKTGIFPVCLWILGLAVAHIALGYVYTAIIKLLSLRNNKLV
jgi:hypothetical protein